MKRVFGILAVTALLAGCSGGGGLSVVETPAELGPIDSTLHVQQMWSVDTGAGADELYLTLQPLVDGDRVFAANATGSVYAYNRDTGKQLWKSDLGGRIGGGPGDGGDLLLFGGDAEVYAIAKEDGKPRWQTPVTSEVLAAPVRAGDKILVRTVDGNLFALAADSGRELWRYQEAVPTLSLRGQGQPVVFGHYAVIGYASGKVIAIDIDNGTPVWETTIAVPHGRTELNRMVDVDGAPVVRDGVIHIAAFQGRVATLSLQSGDLIWVRDVPSFHTLAATEKELFVVDDSSDIWALSRYDGSVMWRSKALHARKLTAPVCEGDYLLVGDLDGYLHWLSQADGHLVGRTKVGIDPILAVPVVVGDRVYVDDATGNLTALQVTVKK